jgi:hypothetical protein
MAGSTIARPGSQAPAPGSVLRSGCNLHAAYSEHAKLAATLEHEAEAALAKPGLCRNGDETLSETRGALAIARRASRTGRQRTRFEAGIAHLRDPRPGVLHRLHGSAARSARAPWLRTATLLCCCCASRRSSWARSRSACNWSTSTQRWGSKHAESAAAGGCHRRRREPCATRGAVRKILFAGCVGT